MKQLWNMLTGSKQAKVAYAFMAIMMAMATSAFAAEPTIDTTQVTSAFNSMSTTVMIIIGSVAASALVIMGAILGWKYGRKLFGMIAK